MKTGVTVAILFTVAFIVALVVLPLIPHSISPDRFRADFLGGVSAEDAADLTVWFDGNHAGYQTAARIRAPLTTLTNILAAVAAKPAEPSELFDPNRIIPEDLKQAWLDAKKSTSPRFFHSKGKNGYTSSFNHMWCLSEEQETLVLIGWGI